MGLSWLGFYPKNFWACNLGLELGACNFSLGLGAWDLNQEPWSMVQCLGYVTCLTFGFQQRLQLPHSLPCFDAGQSPSSSMTVDQWVQADPGDVLFFALLNLITKFLGYEPSGRYLRSCVGSQCMVPGVLLQTSNIFLRWSTPWISPESCQRKCFFI